MNGWYCVDGRYVCKICKSVGYGTGSVSQPDHFSSLLATVSPGSP